MKGLRFGAELRARVAEHAQFHRSPVNRALNYFGIPALGASPLGLLSKVSLPVGAGPAALEPNAAWLAMLVAAVWYFRLGGVAGLPPLAIVAGCYAVGSFFPAATLWGLFGAGSVAHFVGPFAFEGRPPAIFSTPLALLEAPAWLVFLALDPTGGAD